ncbi:MAG TPA: HDOD domain-containing protein [Candidatus Acidoferrales bacterium]|jgi:putative nucleotidyltransferase with HDIG domain|nr:HDOD domain-containing protein [Candidatus Acidoferrales bacterium]
MTNGSGPQGADYQAIDTYLDGIKHLPPPPTVMIQLINLFRQQDADLDEIVALLRRDAALAAEILRRCNNSFMNEDEEAASDINDAVFRLGFYEVYQVTVTLFSLRMLHIEKEAPRFPAEQLRRHSTITGIASGELALELNMSEGVAFTAGLLHDIGKLALALAEGAPYGNMIRDCEQAGTSLAEAEKSQFGFNHTELGGRLLQRWGVPEEVVLPALGHNDPAQPGEMQAYVAITNLSSRLANRIEQKKVSGPFLEMPEVKPLVEFLGLRKEQLMAWEKVVRDKIRQLPAFMGA